MPSHDRAPWSGRASAVALSGALLLLMLSVPPSASPAPRAAPVALASSTPCPGAVVGSTVAGRVADAGGGSSAPPVANQSIVIGYRYTQTFHPQGGGSAAYQCDSTQVPDSTGANGTFSVTLPIEASYCERPYGCWNFSGPYGPVAVGLGGGALPAGYFLSETGSGTAYVLTRVLALASASLDPGGFVTRSVDAPIPVAASGLSGLGAPGPASLTYGWTLQGSGWQLLSARDGATVTVEALSTANVATVTAWVNGSYGGATLHAAPVSVLLTAAATQIQSGAARPTSVDEGIPASYAWNGTGAPGYVYAAALHPGFGLPAVPAACENRSISGDLLEFACSAVYEYPTNAPGGSAQPFATLSNPYSGANYSFGTEVVSAGLVVTVTTPGAGAIAYAGGTVDFRVAIAPGTGTAPYGPACLSDGLGNTDCRTAGGPPWTFTVPYPSTGDYDARASVADSGGTNSTSTVPVEVFARPSAPSITLASSEVPSGGAVRADASISGGAYPISYWWNVSSPSSTVDSGNLSTAPAGPLSVEVPATLTGGYRLSLTEVDALGTQVSESVPYYVVSTNASAIVLDGPPNATAAAGAPVELDFEAVDVLLDPATGFVGNVSIRAAPAGGAPVWLNASATGPLTGSSGSFEVGGGSWRSGFLNLTFTATSAGVVNLTLDPGSGIPGPPAVRLVIIADVASERLAHPDPVRAGSRVNSTLYEIRDRFGNPVPDGWVLVRSVFGSEVSNVASPIRTGPLGSVVWVNYSAPSSGGGTVYVLSESGEALLPPIAVPALASSPVDLEVAGASLAGAAAAVAFAVAIARRRRGPAPDGSGPPEEGTDPEDGLKRLAEGRAHVLDRVPFDAPVDLDHIAIGWTGPPPDAAELAEWVGSLVSEGALRASMGPSGRPMFVRVRPTEATPAPRVEVDPMALDAALERARFESDHPEVVDGWDGPDRKGPPD